MNSIKSYLTLLKIIGLRSSSNYQPSREPRKTMKKEIRGSLGHARRKLPRPLKPIGGMYECR